MGTDTALVLRFIFHKLHAASEYRATVYKSYILSETKTIGSNMSTSRIWNRLQRKILALRDIIRHGGDTSGVKISPYAHLGATPTVSTDYALIPHLLGNVMKPGDVFVDVGCGRGRLLNWALDDGRAKAIFGLELDKRIAAEVAVRLADDVKVTIVAGDALSSLPDSATLLYLWNPFNEDVMRRFKDTVIEKYERLGTLSSLRIVYHNCRHVDIWERERRCRVESVSLPPETIQAAVLITFDGTTIT